MTKFTLIGDDHTRKLYHEARSIVISQDPQSRVNHKVVIDIVLKKYIEDWRLENE